ncbi:RnfABCDGE type electron transport complex subunit B [Clostridium sp. B9]|uniref:RnfABCDGE type electron transport complex subunit B n=1 Tax=Clostridium sp. B9 TaxID=3423224 RepID=UPI003D2F0306
MDFSSILFSILILGILGLLFGILLGFASKKFEVQVDERIPKIRGVLPGANCGGCGYPGCDAYATAMVEDGADITLCGVGGPSVSKAIGEILGVKVKKVEKKVAYVKCNGDCNKKKIALDFPEGKSCDEAKEYISNNEVAGCQYGCFGLGKCAEACKFGAISIVDGLAKIDSSKCVACKACVKACPQNLIDIIKDDKKIIVKCNSRDSGKNVNQNCSVGCIGCKLCERNCPSEAIKINEFLATIDYEKCTSCGICKEKCPKKTINSR